MIVGNFYMLLFTTQTLQYNFGVCHTATAWVGLSSLPAAANCRAGLASVEGRKKMTDLVHTG